MVIYHNTGWPMPLLITFILVLATNLLLVSADIFTSCNRVCERKFEDTAILKACTTGCKFQGETELGDSSSKLNFCKEKCSKDVTSTDENNLKKSAEEACEFACQLPTIRSVMITVNVNNGKATSKVVKSEGVAGDLNVDHFNVPENAFANMDLGLEHSRLMNMFSSKESSDSMFDMNQRMEDMHRDMNEMAKNFLERARESRRRFIELETQRRFESPNYLGSVHPNTRDKVRYSTYDYLDNSNLYRCIVALLFFMAGLALVLVIKGHHLRRNAVLTQQKTVSLPSYKSAVKDSMMTSGEGKKMGWVAVPPADADFSGPPPYDIVTVPPSEKPKIHDSPKHQK